MTEKLIIVRGGGDLATGTIHRLWSAGLPVLVLETTKPAAIRRQVSVCEAVYDGRTTVEGMTAVLTDNYDEVHRIIAEGNVPVMIDAEGKCIEALKPQIVVDAIIAKKNLGTHKAMAPVTIGLGPGFNAGEDVDYCIETKRGHNLGRIIKEGYAAANTGIPGNIGGFTSERVIHASAAGVFYNVAKIGDIVEAGQEIAYILSDEGDRISVKTAISGILRGLLRDSYKVTEHFKIADIDPRIEELANCFTISDKARCIAGSVLEVCVRHFQ